MQNVHTRGNLARKVPLFGQFAGRLPHLDSRRGICYNFVKIRHGAGSAGVLAEVDSIKDEILAILESNYGLNEEEARALLQDDDKVSYTLALDRIANGT